MISTLVLIVSLFLVFLISIVIARALIAKQKLIGRPPVPVFFFVLAKMLVVVNLAFLFLKGLNIPVCRLFDPAGFIEITALVLLILGATILFLSTVALNKDLIFGLSSSGDHRLQTKGIYSISRHPFYLGFIFILFSSCLFTPNIINILSFLGAWIIHHVIMIREEQFLTSQYGDEYIHYIQKVKRYITFKIR
jgi:protein-S-isoprenylcysteine O-methyltransferase Ste14